MRLELLGTLYSFCRQATPQARRGWAVSCNAVLLLLCVCVWGGGASGVAGGPITVFLLQAGQAGHLLCFADPFVLVWPACNFQAVFPTQSKQWQEVS